MRKFEWLSRYVDIITSTYIQHVIYLIMIMGFHHNLTTLHQLEDAYLYCMDCNYIRYRICLSQELLVTARFVDTTRSTQRAQTSLAEADHYSHIAHCKNVEPWL